MQINQNKTEQNDMFLDAAHALCCPKSVLKAIHSLADGNTYTMTELEKKSELRQPDVSIALKWINEQIVSVNGESFFIQDEIKTAGRGRSHKTIKMVVPAEKVIKFMEEKCEVEQKRKDAIEAFISSLKK